MPEFTGQADSVDSVPSVFTNEQSIPETQLPPPVMREVRFHSLPEAAQRYTPEAENPDAYMVVKRDDFMAVVRELAGGMQPFRAFAAKLEEAVWAGAQESFQAAIEAAREQGFAEGQLAGTVDPVIGRLRPGDVPIMRSELLQYEGTAEDALRADAAFDAGQPMQTTSIEDAIHAASEGIPDPETGESDYE